MVKIGLISKSNYIRGLQCPKSLYLYKKIPKERELPSPELLERFRAGNNFGRAAWQLFPHGVDCSPKFMSADVLKKAAVQVHELLASSNSKVLYEATFHYESVVSILDILVKEQNCLHAYEVKSSVEISETYMHDAAFQYYVMCKSGHTPQSFNIVHVKENCSLDQCSPDIMRITNVTEAVKTEQPYVEEQVNAMLKALQTNDTLSITPGPQCECPYHCDYVTYCKQHEFAIDRL